MDKLDHAPSTLSLQSCDTGICCEDLTGVDFSPLNSVNGHKLGNGLDNNNNNNNNRIVVPSFEAIRTAFGKLYDINDFELEKIASGFFGDVYKAIYRPTAEIMVVKCNKKNQGKMLKEVELMRRLGDHPNIIKFKGGCVDGAKVYSLTDYMNGGTLEQLLTSLDEPITWPQREKLCHDIALGMQYLHAKKYMHRDLTTRNVLIRVEQSVAKNCDSRFLAVVADFGLATEIPQRLNVSISNSSSSSTPNKPLAVVGSAWWMAPECIELAINSKAKFSRSKERGYNERVDVFSYGIIVCQVCARIEADPEYLQRTANYGVDYMALSKLVEDNPIARHLMLLAMDCTKYNPEERPTFTQIAERLARSRAYGPGHHLVDKRLRSKQVWRPASTSPFLSNANSGQQLLTPCGSPNVPADSTHSAMAATPVHSSSSQLPQVWVHTVIRTIDPDFRPARSNPFAALEDHFRDGRKMVQFASSGLGSLVVDDSSPASPPPPLDCREPMDFHEYKLSEVSFQLFGSLSEGFGDSASSLSMSVSPGDHIAGSSGVPSLRTVMSPPSSLSSSVSPFTPVQLSHRKYASSSMETTPPINGGSRLNNGGNRALSVAPINGCSSSNSPNVYTVLGADSNNNNNNKVAVRSLPNSPCTTRRAKSVYVGSSTAIRFFSPSNQLMPGDGSLSSQNEASNASVLNARNTAISRTFSPSSGRVVWSRVRFFETLSQEQQQRWHMMITNNKIAEEQRRGGASSTSSSVLEADICSDSNTPVVK